MSAARRQLHALIGDDNLGVRVTMRGYDLVLGDLHKGYRDLTPAEERQVVDLFAARGRELDELDEFAARQLKDDHA